MRLRDSRPVGRGACAREVGKAGCPPRPNGVAMVTRGPSIACFRRLASLGAALVAVGLGSPLAPAQGQGVEDWSQTLTLLGSQLQGRRLAADASGSIYVTGHYFNYRIVTARLAPNRTVLWQHDFSNPGTREHADWMTIDPRGGPVAISRRSGCASAA